MESKPIICPNCPVCEGKPLGLILHEQRFCANEDCAVLMFNPTLPAEEQRKMYLDQLDRGEGVQFNADQPF